MTLHRLPVGVFQGIREVNLRAARRSIAIPLERLGNPEFGDREWPYHNLEAIQVGAQLRCMTFSCPRSVLLRYVGKAVFDDSK